MAALALIVAVLLVAFNGGAAELKGNFQTSSLICDAQGFAPTFEYSTQGEEQEFKFDVILGNGDGNCTYNGMDYNVNDTVAENKTVVSSTSPGITPTSFLMRNPEVLSAEEPSNISMTVVRIKLNMPSQDRSSYTESSGAQSYEECNTISRSSATWSGA